MKVEIKDEIIEKLKKRVDDGEFKTVDEYVNYVLQQVVERLDSESGEKEEAYTKEDEEKVKERLRSLGYME